MKSQNVMRFSFANFSSNFDRHIRESIRGFDYLVQDCIGISEKFVKDDTTVLDIGCSTGYSLQMIRNKNHFRCPKTSYIGIDIEQKFEQHWRKSTEYNLIFLIEDVVIYDFPYPSSFITSLFTLQFIQERDRYDVIKKIFDSLEPGGALIIAEKIKSNNSDIENLISKQHFDFKRQYFTDEEINQKTADLKSLMHLWTEDNVLEMLTECGFNRANIQCIWRMHNFVGWVAIR